MSQRYLVEGKRIPELLILNTANPNTWIPIYETFSDTTKRISLATIINFLNVSITSTGFTEQQVRDTPLTGLVFTDGTPITSVDTVIIALGKLQQQINNISILIGSSEAGIHAYNAGGQVNATQILKKTNRIDFCTTDLGSIKTFAAIEETEIYIQNNTLKKINVFPKLNEQFMKNGVLLGLNVPIMVASRNNITFYCYKGEIGIFTQK